MRFSNKIIFSIIFILVFQFGMSQNKEISKLVVATINAEPENYRININRNIDPIRIDGLLEEETWAQADVATDFWMSFPVDDRHATKDIQTKVMMTYDEQNIYVAAVCYGPDDYIIQSLKRDNMGFWDGDAFSLVFDPVNERTNGFTFAVNPSNVQFEALVSGQTGRRGQENSSGISVAWDNKWYSAVQSSPESWTVEMSIPFKSLRYKEGQTVWGVNFIRGEPRTNSYHTWAPVPVQFVGVDLGYTGTLVWDTDPPQSKSNMSVIPYISASTNKDFETGTKENSLQAGMDAKVAITSSLNLDLTVNPDFSQVEVDQQVTNLTTFSVRFPERRLFFLENSDLFQDFGIPPMRPFFSRRIGLDDDGNTIPIQYGLRLSGNFNKDLRIGLLNMQTKSQDLNPGNNYTALAFHHQVLGRSVIRAYFNNRQGKLDGEFQNDNYNRTAGLEFNFRSEDGRVNAFAGYGKSFTGHIDNSDNYFYNLGGGYDSRTFSFYTNLAGVGDNYYADMGFIPTQDHYDAEVDTTFHVGYTHWYTRMGYTLFPKNNEKIISHVWSLNNILDLTSNGGVVFGNRTIISYEINWKNTSKLMAEYTVASSRLLYPFDFTDTKPLPAQKYNYGLFGVNYSTDQRKLFSAKMGVAFGEFYSGKRTQYQLNLIYRRQPWGRFDLTFEQNNIRFPEEYGDISLFLLGPRIEINFSNQFSWTTFLQYNTQDDNFNINSRIQWRYQPMSDIYLVYTDNYFVENWGPKNRALVLKANYWLNL